MLVKYILFLFSIVNCFLLSAQCTNSSFFVQNKGFEKSDIADLKESLKLLNHKTKVNLIVFFKPSFREIYDSAWDYCLTNRLLDCKCANIKIVYFKPDDVEKRVMWRNNKFYFRESPGIEEEIPFTANFVRFKCLDSGLMKYMAKDFSLKRSPKSDFYYFDIIDLRLGSTLSKLNQIISTFESMKAAYEYEKRFLYINNKLDSIVNKDKLLLDSILKITKKIPRYQKELSLSVGYGNVHTKSTAFRQLCGKSKTIGFEYRSLRIPANKSEVRLFFGNSLKFNYYRSDLVLGTTFNEGHEDIGIYYLNSSTVSLPYRRLVYYNGIKEKVQIDNFNVGLGKTLSIVNKNRNSNTSGRLAKAMSLDLSAGLLINIPLRAIYNASAGSLSWGGIFEAYNESDTMFSGLYDFKTNVSANDKVQKLNINNFNPGLYADLLYRIYSGKKNTGCVIIGLSGSTIRTDFFSSTGDDMFNYNNDKYNSLLYRKSSKTLYLSSLSVRLGYSLCF
jgi:hypothetical protein